MKKFAACVVTNSPGMISVHSVISYCDDIKGAEEAIVNYRSEFAGPALDFYIQMIDTDVGVYVIPMTTPAGEFIAPKLGV